MSSPTASFVSGVMGDTLHVGDADDATLLSGYQFFFLCLVVAASYYVALFISANAVGESTASLAAPVAAASQFFSDVGSTIMRSINRRRNNTQAGAVTYEEVEDDNDIFLGVNQPAAGVRS